MSAAENLWAKKREAQQLAALRPWVATIGARTIGRAETRIAAQNLVNGHEGLTFVTNEVTGERWLKDFVRGWREFVPLARSQRRMAREVATDKSEREPPWWLRD